MRLLILFCSLLLISACAENTNNTPSEEPIPEFTLSCDLNVAYTPLADPIESPSSNGTPASITVLVLHGKNGSPNNSGMNDLRANLNAAGYNVVMPYLPWTGTNWNGTLCDGMAYINQIIDAERAKSTNYILLLGHSLGATNALAYTALSDTSKPENLIAVAPGHYLHESSILSTVLAPSISLAKNMVANGQSNDIATFQTYNNGQTVDISTTPLIYLSFHDTAEFPDIKSSINEIETRILWLAGQSDSLTNSAKNLGIIDIVEKNKNITYKEVSGDHFTILQNVPSELLDFF
ncbi:MAG: alpha/beta hydrolase [Gammaproteobacteria bacterium]|nr:alpha/beta hydrolase [Gammaproteobacteria bacterium]